MISRQLVSNAQNSLQWGQGSRDQGVGCELSWVAYGDRAPSPRPLSGRQEHLSLGPLPDHQDHLSLVGVIEGCRPTLDGNHGCNDSRC